MASTADVVLGRAPARGRVDPSASRTLVSLVDLAWAAPESDLAGCLLIPRSTVGGRELKDVEARLLPDGGEWSAPDRGALLRLATREARAAVRR